MSNKSIQITGQMRDAINEFLGTELIPACAVGNELMYVNGNFVIKTFRSGNMHGYRKLSESGELFNIITELQA